MKKYLLGAIALFFVITITASALFFSAQAQENDNAAETKLKMIFSDIIQQNKDNIAKRGATMNVIGDINIENAGSYYAVTLPEIIVSEQNGDETQIGMIAVNATPTDNFDKWKMAVALPTPFVKNNAMGKKIGQFDIGNQKFAGLYDAKIKNFTTLALDYSALKFSDYVENKIVDIDNLTVISDLQINGDTLSGPTNAKMSDITFADIDTANKTTIDEVNLTAEYAGLDIFSIIQNTGNININKLGGIQLKAQIKDIESDFKLSRVEFEYDGEKPQNGLSDQKFKIKFNGLNPKQNSGSSTEFLPESLNIDFDFNKLPLADLISLGMIKMSANDENPAAALNLLQAITSLPAKMARAGSNLDIDNIDFKNALYDIKTKGKLKADDTSPLKIVGDIMLSANGLDKTKSVIEEKIPAANSQEKQAMVKVRNQINFIQEKCDGAAGNYVCNINLSKEGKVTINNNAINFFELLALAQ